MVGGILLKYIHCVSKKHLDLWY